VVKFAAEFARDLFTNGEPRRYAYLVLRDTPGNQPGEGGSWSERAVADRIATAIARALGGDGEPVVTDWDRRLAEFDDDPRLAPAASEVRRVRALWANEPSADRTKCMDRAIAGAVLRFVDSTRPAATGDTTDDACPHHSETGLGGCGRFAWHCDGCGRIRWIYDASKGIGSRADVPRGVVLEGPPTTAVEIARRMLTLGDVALLLERAGSSDDEQGSAQRTLLRLEALRNALAAEATRAATGGPDAR